MICMVGAPSVGFASVGVGSGGVRVGRILRLPRGRVVRGPVEDSQPAGPALQDAGRRRGLHPGLSRPAIVRRVAPVRLGSVDGRPCQLSQPMSAMSTASFDPSGRPRAASVVSRVTVSPSSARRARMSVGFRVPPPEAMTAVTPWGRTASAMVRAVSAVTVAIASTSLSRGWSTRYRSR